MKPTKHIAEQFILPGTPEPVVDHDKLMAEQLTQQYHRAVGGMREVLIFGAMMLRLKAEVENWSTRGPVSGGRGNQGGLNEWLRTHAPEVKKSTAYRFMAIAEAVKADFTLPAKITKQVDFPTLVTTPPEELPASIRAKQEELFDFVTGTSQRSWLDKLKPRKPAGGDVTPRDPETGERIKKQKTAEDIINESVEIWRPIMRDLENHGLEFKTWVNLPDDHREHLLGILTDLTRLIRESKGKQS